MNQPSFHQEIVASQTQRLEHRMTQQQIQSVELLQKTEQELAQELTQKLEENPVLEMKEGREVLAGDMQELTKYSDMGDYAGGRFIWNEADEKRRSQLMESLTREATPTDKLEEQLADRDLSDELQEICRDVVVRIDELGRLHGTDEELAADMGKPLELVRRAVAVVQGLEPAGIGGRDLREALLLQLERQGRKGSIEWRICDGYLEELGKNRVREIAKALGCSVEEVERARERIGRLHEYPGRMLSDEAAKSILVEFTVKRGENGSWVMISNKNAFPKITINPDYEDMAEEKTLDPESKSWLSKKLEEGRQLIEALDFRKSTVERVAEQIVLMQQDYFTYGDSRLKPMLMKTVAERLGVDESTVSRAVNGKYMQTPFGVMELRKFFSSAPGSGELSSLAIQTRIREMIQAENPTKPYSDEEIAGMLALENIPVARRTVAKYRDLLGIPRTSLRRRHGGV